jgi:hypothetical protein
MNTTVKFMIRAQAQNGMLLGPDSYNGAIITIRNLATGEQLAQGLMNNGNSGSRVSAPSAWTSPYTIVTPTLPEPTTYYVQADENSVGYAIELPIKASVVLEITAQVPMTNQGRQEFPTAKILQHVLPGDDFSQGIGLVIPIPCLWVQPEVVLLGLQLRVRAKVMMMCGCLINTDATTPYSPWLPEDFSVEARVNSISFNNRINPYSEDFPMAFEINSQFFVDVTLPSNITPYNVTIYAFQGSSKLKGMVSVVAMDK